MEEINKNKKICFFLADMTKKGGIERVTSILFNELIKLDYNVEIVSQFKSYEKCDFKLDIEEKVKFITDKTFKEKPGSVSRLFKHLFNIKNIRTFFKKNSYDCIVSQGFPNTVLLCLAGVAPEKIIAAEHVHYDYYKTNFFKRLRKFFYLDLKDVVVLTEKDKEKFKEIEIEAKVIPNPVEISDICLPLINKTNKLISVGRLVEQKGYDLLIKSCKEIFKKHPEWILDIYGEGPLKEELEEKILVNQLNKNIFLKGITNKINEKYKESSIYVMSSRYEGFPMVLLEAMTNGLPCVSFDCPNGPSDIIEDRVNGILVENGNIKELSEKIIFLIENDEIRNEMSQKTSKIAKKYGKENILKKWEQLFL